MCRRFTKPSKKATSPASTNSHRVNARIGIFAVRKTAAKRQHKATDFFMADKTQDCSVVDASPEITSRELLNELLSAEFRQLRIRNLAAEERLTVSSCDRASVSGAGRLLRPMYVRFPKPSKSRPRWRGLHRRPKARRRFLQAPADQQARARKVPCSRT